MQLIDACAVIIIGIIVSKFLEDPKIIYKVLNSMTFNLRIFLPALILMLLWKGNISKLSIDFTIVTLLSFFIIVLLILY